MTNDDLITLAHAVQKLGTGKWAQLSRDYLPHWSRGALRKRYHRVILKMKPEELAKLSSDNMNVVNITESNNKKARTKTINRPSTTKTVVRRGKAKTKYPHSKHCEYEIEDDEIYKDLDHLRKKNKVVMSLQH
eukprot:UN27756